QAQRGRVALPEGVVPDTLAASTDFGNVSQLVPGIHPMVKVSPEDVALHTDDFAKWANTPAAKRAAVDSAAGLAQIALDLLADDTRLDAARTEVAQAGGPGVVTDLVKYILSRRCAVCRGSVYVVDASFLGKACVVRAFVLTGAKGVQLLMGFTTPVFKFGGCN